MAGKGEGNGGRSSSWFSGAVQEEGEGQVCSEDRRAEVVERPRPIRKGDDDEAVGV